MLKRVHLCFHWSEIVKGLLFGLLIVWSVAGLAENEIYFLLNYQHADTFPKENAKGHPAIQGHHQYLANLTSSGKLLLGGGVKSTGVKGAGGMMLVKAEDLAAANALASADPGVAAGLLNVNVSQWNVRFSNMRFVKPRAGRKEISAEEAFVIKRNDPDAQVRQDP